MICSRSRWHAFRTSPRRWQRCESMSPHARMTGSGGCVFASFAHRRGRHAPRWRQGRRVSRASSRGRWRAIRSRISHDLRDGFRAWSPRAPCGRAGFSAGESPSGKAPDFDSGIRRFDPYLPSHSSRWAAPRQPCRPARFHSQDVMAFERMRVFTGNANPKLAEAVCRHLNISLGRASSAASPTAR